MAGSSYQEARDRIAIEKKNHLQLLWAVGLAPGRASQPLGDRLALSGGSSHFAMMDICFGQKKFSIFDNIYKRVVDRLNLSVVSSLRTVQIIR